MPWTKNNVLYPAIIHGSLRTPVSTNLKVSKAAETPACVTFFSVCRNGLENV